MGESSSQSCGEYILVHYFVEQFGIISQKKQCLDLRLLAFMFRYTCVLHCSSKNPETTHQGTVEFFATFRKIKVHVCFQGERERERESVCVCVCVCVCWHMLSFLVLCVFCLFLRIQKKTLVSLGLGRGFGCLEDNFYCSILASYNFQIIYSEYMLLFVFKKPI